MDTSLAINNKYNYFVIVLTTTNKYVHLLIHLIYPAVGILDTLPYINASIYVQISKHNLYLKLPGGVIRAVIVSFVVTIYRADQVC